MLKYDTEEQARFRLRRTVITDHQHAYYVHDVYTDGSDGRIKMQIQRFPVQTGKHQAITVDADDERFNFRRFPLGYVNDSRRKSATFYVRGTYRQQHQGFHYSTVEPQMREGLAMHTDLEDTFFDRFPTIEEAFRRVNEDGWSICAISRDFAVGRHDEMQALRVLYYRGRPVGVTLAGRFEHFIVDPANEYLSEALTEAGFPFVLDKNNG